MLPNRETVYKYFEMFLKDYDYYDKTVLIPFREKSTKDFENNLKLWLFTNAQYWHLYSHIFTVYLHHIMLVNLQKLVV